MPDKNVHPEDYIAFPSLKLLVRKTFKLLFVALRLARNAFRFGYGLIIAGALAGGLVGLVYRSLNTKNYKVSMVMEYTALDKRAYSDMLAQLNLLASTGSKQALAQELKIPAILADNISSVDASNLEDESLRKDTSTNQLIKVTVGLQTSYGIDSLQDALLGYFNDNPYLKKLKADRIKLYEDQLAYIDDQQGKMDTLKREYTRSLANMKAPASGLYYNAFDPAALYKESYALDTLKVHITNWLNHSSKPVALLTGFRATDRPRSLSLSVSIVACIIVGIFIGFFFSFLIEINKWINAA